MALLGQGLLALTVDQRSSGGELAKASSSSAATRSDCMLNYFQRSEQVRTGNPRRGRP